MKFKDLQLNDQLLRAIAYPDPTPIQSEAIPKIMAGCDLFASAQTGTGKTAAFLLPTLNRLVEESKVTSKGPRILILCPTRELACQVAKQSEKYSSHLRRVKTVCIYGGVPYPEQNRKLSRFHDVLIATPGRLLDHIKQGRIDFSRLETFILDEADRLLDMGFIHDVEKIGSFLPENRQTLLFSATMEGAVLKLSKKLLKEPVTISLNTKRETNKNIEQRLHIADNIQHKQKMLEKVLLDRELKNSIVFTATKRQADNLVKTLDKWGLVAEALHGDINQRRRTRTIKNFTQGKFHILIATDVAARGIDIPTISHVINFDLPNNVEDYVHRIGRTGRAGAKGIALSFAKASEGKLLAEIEKYQGEKIKLHTLSGLEPSSKLSFKSEGNKGAPKRGRRSSFPKSKNFRGFRKKR